jgi:hypothetical protein
MACGGLSNTTRTLIVNEEDVMTTATDSKELISDLSDLIELDYDAIAAYKIAIERLEKTSYKRKLTEFLGDHERHVVDLGKAVRKEGGTPPTEGGAMQIMTTGKVVLAELFGDEAILKAMLANEGVTNTKYEEAAATGYPVPIGALVRKGLADERRHKDWLAITLGKS